MNLTALIIQLIAGALGGNAAGNLSKVVPSVAASAARLSLPS